MSGEEIDQILEDLERSFRGHENDENSEVVSVFEASSDSDTSKVVAAKMALGALRAPTRGHQATLKHPTSTTRTTLYHYLDKVHDWNDTHHGWTR